MTSPKTTLTWLKPDSPWHVQSACRRYHVSKASTMGGFKYTAWGPGEYERLGVTLTLEEAKALCQAHADAVGAPE